MTKRKSKSARTTVKAAVSKASVIKSSGAPTTAATPPLIVLGFDDQQKPRGAKFIDAKPNLVTKAADLMGFKVYQATAPDVAEAAKKLPLGRLYANGRGFVPNIRQSLYSDLVVALGLEPQGVTQGSRPPPT
jgi:TPR repeat protein